MDKRYQVFISSTFTDLQEERRQVIQAVMEMDCFPSGMELFPAADEEQWHFIKRVIDDCDYYILIIGGRYGSLTNEGISYTEKEYDYAVTQGVPVLAFLHGNPDEIPISRSEIRAEIRDKLEQFRSRVADGRLVRFWKSADMLPGLVALSLSKTIKTHPRNGWVRATSIASVETLSELNDLRKRLAETQSELAEARTEAGITTGIDDLASLDELVTVKGTLSSKSGNSGWSTRLTWRELFATISPSLMLATVDSRVNSRLAALLAARVGKDCWKASIDDIIFDTIKIQLMAYGLVSVKPLNLRGGGIALFWQITPKGGRLMLESRTVRAANQESIE